MTTFQEIMDYSPENQKVFDKLSGLCIRGLIVPYIGAGMSAFAGFIPQTQKKELFPTWGNLLQNLYRENLKEEMPVDEDYIDIADSIEKKIGKEKFYEKIRVTMGGDLSSEEWNFILTEANKQATSIIPKLFFNPIITTNYDQIIEKTHDNKLPVAFPYNTKALELSIDKREPILYKIHGCVSDAQNIVLSKNVYEEVYKPNSHLVYLLSKLCQSFHFLFLGCSLELNSESGTVDYSTQLLLGAQKRSEMPHYAIVNCKKDATEEEIRARRNELEKEHIFPILFETGKFESIKIILEELSNRIQKQLFEEPKYNTHFTERTDSIIGKMGNNLISSNYCIIALVGDGGVGKTRIASEYARKTKEKTDRKVFWFNAISAENIREEIRQFVILYKNIPKEEKDIQTILNVFRQWVEENDNYLFILDNVENYEDVEIFLNDDFKTLIGTRHIVITSRLHEDKTPSIVTPITINVFKIEEAQNFLQSHTEQPSNKYADEIAELLGYLPLALEQASAYIREEKKTYKNYLKLLEKEPFEYLKDAEPGAVSVRATWNIAMQRIKSESAKELLQLCAYLAPDNIDSQWFMRDLKILPTHLQNDISTQLCKIEEQLTRYSLVKIKNGKINIHRLLQGVIKKTLEREQEKWKDTCIQILNNLVYDDFSTLESRKYFMEVEPHIISCINKKSNKTNKIEEVANLYHFLGYGFDELQVYDKALEYYQEALSIHNNVIKKVSSNSAMAQMRMGVTFYYKGEYEEALKCYRDSEKAFISINKKYPDLAKLYNNIAIIYDVQDKFDEALQWYYKSLHLKIELYGKTDPLTATTYDNIAGILNEMGEHLEALNIQKEVREILEKTYGENHPETAKLYNYKGRTYYSLKRYEQALALYNKALNIYKSIDEYHREVAVVYNDITVIYDIQEKYDNALDHGLKALLIWMKIGKEHPKTQKTVQDMAFIYNKKNHDIPFEKWLIKKIKERN